MTDIIVIAILVVVVGSALGYIIHEKKRGKCIGCPYAENCHACHQTGASACGCHTEQK